MSRAYQSFASIAPSRTDNAYIFALVPTVGNGLAAITSADELLVVDQQNLTSNNIISFSGAPTGVNCLVSGDGSGQLLLCSGTDGNVATFDVRSQQKTSNFRIDRGVTALACQGYKVAVGTEFKHQQAIVSVWDSRQNRQIWQNAENNDEITAVGFHPTRDIILAGGDDGLVSLFDTTIVEEEDSLIQAINHGPIHKAGFLGDSRLYALSSDQNFAIHPVSTPGDEEDPQPILFGDLRPIVPCQYVIDVQKHGGEIVVVGGTNIDASHIDLVRLDQATNMSAQPSLDLSSKYALTSAHGEEVVRAIVIDDQSGSIFTAGEDGFIRAFQQSVDVKPAKSTKSKKGSEVRYKPY